MLINPFIFMKWERWCSLQQKGSEHHFVFRMHLINDISYMLWSLIKSLRLDRHNDKAIPFWWGKIKL